MHGFLLLFLSVSIFLILDVNSELARCLNNGTPLNSTSCHCPAFIAGDLCETVKCQRYGIPDRNRCHCPAGWYDKYCGIRGCRPANEDNLNLSKRSMIIVFNTKTSMSSQLQVLISKWSEMISSITTNMNTAATDDWIENFIYYGFVKKGNTTETNIKTFDTSEKILEFLKTVKLSDGDTMQPVLTALKTVQQSITTMKSHSIVLVFTDSPASDAPVLSHRFAEGNVEQLLYQIILDWRSKVSFILSFANPTDFSLDSVDVYRRLSTATHGDVFLSQNETDLVEILEYTIAYYYFPENIAVGYGVSGNMTIPVQRDDDYNVVFILITTLNSQNVPEVESGTQMAIGSNFKLFFSRSSSIINIISSNDNYNYRIFLQSKKTLLFDYNDDMTIDVGNTIVNKKIEMTSTVRTFGFDFGSILNHTYHVTDAKNNLIRGMLTSWPRPQLDCTFEYGFDAWKDTETCPSGPIIQIHQISIANVTYQRVIPGYCDDVAHFTHQTPQRDILPYPPKTDFSSRTESIIDNNVQTCVIKNYDIINDPRLRESNQLIFILELHSNNKPIYNQLAREIASIVNLTDTNPNTFEKEYTLIVHDNQTSRVLLSSYSAQQFAAKFTQLVSDLDYVENLDNTMGLLSIVQAGKSMIQPAAQIFYFTNQAVTQVQSVQRPWDIIDRSIEVNVVTISDNKTTEIFAMPSEIELAQKSTNGRIIPLPSNGLLSMLPIFKDIVFETALTTDHEKYNCVDAPYFVDAYIEKNAINAVVQLVGTGLHDIRINDPTGAVFDHHNYVSFESNNFYSINIDLTTKPRGIWRIGTSTSRGGCQITVRHQTSTGILLGFANSSSSDDATSQIPLQRTSNSNQTIFVATKITNQDLASLSNIDLQIELVNRKRYDMPVFFSKASVSVRDNITCSFNMISTAVTIPKNDLTLFTLTGYDLDSELIFRRVFYYYQHIPADLSVCNGGLVDSFGLCQCPTGYTGEYCHDRLCVNGATRNFHICSCNSGFIGDFCEIELMEDNQVETTTMGGAQKMLNFAMILVLIVFNV